MSNRVKPKIKNKKRFSSLAKSSNGHDTRRFVELGMAFHKQGNLEEASVHYKKAINVDENNPDANHLLGVIHTQLGDIPQAIELIEKSLNIQPFNALAHYNLGFALQKIYRCDKAAVCYQAALNINPNHIEALANLGSMYMYLEKPFDAEKTFRKAVSLAPARVDVLNNLGMCLFEQGNLDTAQHYYEKVVALDSENAEAFNNIARIQQKRGDVDSAISNYRTAIQIKSDYVKALNNLAAALDMLGDYDSAIGIYNKVLTIQPDCATTHIALAIYHWVSGKVDYAENHIRKVKNFRKLEYSTKQNKFISGYYQFINGLTVYRQHYSEEYHSNNQGEMPILYVIGDSHCVSYSNVVVDIDGISHKVISKLVVGAKAWHLANNQGNEYKVGFSSALDSIPVGAKVAVVFGEIDCRIDEGVIPSVNKNGSDMSEVVNHLVSDYVSYVGNKCEQRGVQPWFVNVPAPVRSDERSTGELMDLKSVVELFNRALNHSINDATNAVCDVLDVYSLSNDQSGLSSGVFHIDGIHMKPSVLPRLFLSPQREG